MNRWKKQAQSNVFIFHYSGLFWSQTIKQIISRGGVWGQELLRTSEPGGIQVLHEGGHAVWSLLKKGAKFELSEEL